MNCALGDECQTCCKACQREGVCFACDGTGRDTDAKGACFSCAGTGTCRSCAGTGKRLVFPQPRGIPLQKGEA